MSSARILTHPTTIRSWRPQIKAEHGVAQTGEAHARRRTLLGHSINAVIAAFDRSRAGLA
jgi:hypothetical protein